MCRNSGCDSKHEAIDRLFETDLVQDEEALAQMHYANILVNAHTSSSNEKQNSKWFDYKTNTQNNSLTYLLDYNLHS